MSNIKIGTYEAISIALVSIISHLLLNLPQTIINTTGSASLLNIIYISIIVLLLNFIIIKIVKLFPNSDLIDISEFLGGKWLKMIITLLFTFYLFLFAATLLRNAAEALKVIYFFQSPVSFVLIFFIIPPIIANYFGEKAIIRCNFIITPILLLILLIPFISIFPELIIQRGLPIFGYGIKETFVYGLENVFAFNGFLFLLFVTPMLSNKNNIKKIGIITILTTSFFLLIAVSSLLLAFPYATSVESISPIYLAILNTQFSNFLQRPEAIFIFFWILYIISYLNIIIMFIIKSLNKILPTRNSKLYPLPICVILFCISLIPSGMTEIRFLENYVYKYFTIFMTFILGFGILILAYFKLSLKRRKEQSNE